MKYKIDLDSELLLNYDVAEYAEYIQDMNIEELQKERNELKDLFDYNINKRNDIMKQIEQYENSGSINLKWYYKAKMALLYCKKDLNKINLFLAEIKDKMVYFRKETRIAKIENILMTKYPEIYNEILESLKNE